MTRRSVTKEDLLQLKFTGDPQVSPDGRRVILTLKEIDAEKNKYWSHLWLYDVRDDALRPFTFGEVSDTSPRWSPDGMTVAFLRTVNDQTQIWVIPVDGGEARQLTELDKGSLSGLAWSPDSQRLAFCFRPTHPDWTQKARKEREACGKSTPPRLITRVWYRLDGVGFLDERQHLRVCDVATGEVQQITDGDADDDSPCWSPDGSKIAFVSNRSEDPAETPYEVDLWWVAPEGGKLHKIETPPGYKGGLAWSPDGSMIAYVGVETEEDPWVPQHDRLWVVSPEGGDARCLTAGLDRTVGNATLSDTREAHLESAPLWSRDSKRLYLLTSDRGSCHLTTVGARGGEPTPLTEGALDVAAVSADRDGTVFGLLVATPTRPAEVYLGTLERDDLELRQITRFNNLWLEDVALSEPEELWFTTDDETEIQGWLLKPPDFDAQGRYPLVLYIHGGPHAQYGHTFFHEFQWLAAQGYVVLYTNPRGSSGYTERFMTAIRGNWGELDYHDVMAAVDEVASRPYIDEARLAVAGGSYGGYMTNWIIGHTDRFKCAVTDRSVVNLESMFGTCDVAFRSDGYWPGNPWDDPEALRRQSPLRYLSNVKTPVLIIHSEGDLRCPIEQAEQLFTALKRLKADVVFVRYPQETSHGLSRGGPPDLRLDRLARIGEWLDKHLSLARPQPSR